MSEDDPFASEIYAEFGFWLHRHLSPLPIQVWWPILSEV